MAVQFGIHVSVHLKNVLQAVVIQIHQADAPSYILRIHRQTRFHDRSFENAAALISIYVGVIAGKIGLQDVQFSVAVIIPDSHSHTALLETMLVERNSSLGGDLGKSSVLIVPEKQARRGIARDIDIGPAISVEVRRYGRESIHAFRDTN